MRIQETLLTNFFLAVSAVHLAGAGAPQSPGPPPGDTESIRRFLIKYFVVPRGFDKDQKAQFLMSRAVLGRSDQRQEIVVYYEDKNYCGSGGCVLLILIPRGSSFEVIGRTTITRLPIRVLKTYSNGYHDLGVWLQGGGILPGHEALVPFDGRRYSSNPSTAPCRAVALGTPGNTLIARKAYGHESLVYPQERPSTR